jgi:membrane protease YdiL (CAAX protease family)
MNGRGLYRTLDNTMSVPSLWEGLGKSAFLLGGGGHGRDRAPLTVAVTVGGGLGVAIVATLCVWCLTMIPYTLATGHGAAGLDGLMRAWLDLVKPPRWDLGATIAFLLVTTILDAAPMVAFVAFAAALAHRHFTAYVTAARRFRWRLMGLGLVLAAVVLAPMVVAERTVGGDPPLPILMVSPSTGGRLLYLAASLMLIPAAAAEELMFRGWLLRQTHAFLGGTAGLLFVSSVLFAGAHFAFDPALMDPDAFLQLALMGAGFAYMTLRLGGIEFSTGAHAANNLLIVLFLQPLRPQLPHASGGPLSLITAIALLAGYFIMTEAVVRWPLLRRLAGLEPAEISPPDSAGPEAERG